MAPRRVETAFRQRLDQYHNTLANSSGGDRESLGGDVGAFFAPTVDLWSAEGIMRGRDQVAAAVGDALSLRASAEALRPRHLTNDIAIVDSVTETPEGRAWFTEIWQTTDGDSTVQTFRPRIGSPTLTFDALSALTPTTVSDTVPEEVQQAEELALRGQFAAFRTAFNAGDSRTVARIAGRSCDAIPVFSFIGGRSQVLAGRAAVGAKAERMIGENVINPAPDAQRATVTGGESKRIRFLSPTVAVVDGTEEISSIPRAHGFSPRN